MTHEVFCPSCGTRILVEDTERAHAKRGSGSTTYVIQHLNDSHKNALVALFNLGASNIDRRRSLPEVCFEIKKNTGRFPNRNGTGGRLSELQRIDFVKCYSKIQVTDPDLPEYRDEGQYSGWYLTSLGLKWCNNKIEYLNGEVKELAEVQTLGDMVDFRKPQTVVIENGQVVNRKELVIEK